MACKNAIAGPAYPNDGTTDPNQYTSKLNGTTNQLGAMVALKVMLTAQPKRSGAGTRWILA
jgi:hypothetical protein